MEQLVVEVLYSLLIQNKLLANFFALIYYSSYFIPIICLYFFRDEKLKKFLLVLIISALIGVGLKFSVNRTRPYVELNLTPLVEKENDPSFPSLHSVIYFSVALFLDRRSLLFYIFLIALPLTLIFLAVHYPSDILASLLIVSSIYYLITKKIKL